MATIAPTKPDTELLPDLEEMLVDEPGSSLDYPWVCLLWNDEINLFGYVICVLMKIFSYPKEEAERLTMQVHKNGKAVVSDGTREKVELDCQMLHSHGLWATMQEG